MEAHQHETASSPRTGIDPVCGMTVDLDHPPGGKVTCQGREIGFCSPSCRAKFEADPKRYLGNEKAPPVATPRGMKWTCPMHPQIVRSEPGFCPICGMALEPRTATVADDYAELRDMTRRFWTSVALSIPVLALAMSDMLPGQPVQHALGMRAIQWIELLLASPVVLWGGWPFFQRAWASVVNRSANMFTLIGIGIGAAYGYSAVATVAPQIFPATVLGADGQAEVYFEVAATV